VVVKRQQTAQNGEIIIAMIDDEATCKRYFKETDRIRLQPENPRMRPFYARLCPLPAIERRRRGKQRRNTEASRRSSDSRRTASSSRKRRRWN
ncbi:MAG: hypothetical protein ILP09_02165, partial [Oscillospiraceae bacterium]|nr:hypothetical protein [Oscillospiraceae bacterium]